MMLRLYYFSNYTWEEVAVRMGINWRSVHRRHAAILERLAHDEEEKKGLNLLVNTLGKTNADLMFFFNPGAMMNVGSNPVPPLKTLTDALKIIPVTIKTLSGNARYENGPWKDHLRYEKWVYMNIPFIAAPTVKMISLADNQYDYSGVEK